MTARCRLLSAFRLPENSSGAPFARFGAVHGFGGLFQVAFGEHLGSGAARDLFPGGAAGGPPGDRVVTSVARCRCSTIRTATSINATVCAQRRLSGSSQASSEDVSWRGIWAATAP